MRGSIVILNSSGDRGTPCLKTLTRGRAPFPFKSLIIGYIIILEAVAARDLIA
jgi:hypothetical protein